MTIERADLDMLWTSTESFFERFGVKPDLTAQLRVAWEELGEYLSASTPDETHLEAADVLVTCFSIHIALERENYHLSDAHLSTNDAVLAMASTMLEPSDAMVNITRLLAYAVLNTTPQAVQATALKLDAKTWKTHYIDHRGKISKRPALLQLGTGINKSFAQDAD